MFMIFLYMFILLKYIHVYDIITLDIRIILISLYNMAHGLSIKYVILFVTGTHAPAVFILIYDVIYHV